jgi:proteasome assembly chaperone (PAC2) family protein
LKSFSGEETGMSPPLKLRWHPELKKSALVVGWSVDVSRVGARVTDYLITRLRGKSFCEIDPGEFFPMRGVIIEDDLVQFPGSKFYVFPDKELVILKSAQPSFEWYRFLSLVLDVSEQYCGVKELYNIGSMVSFIAHTAPRYLMAICNSMELKDTLVASNLRSDLYYETPSDQRPTISAFLLWVAKTRNIPGANIMVPVPFYLATLEDLKAQKRVLDFLNQRFKLGCDFSDLDEQILKQNTMIAGVRDSAPEVDSAITKLESNLRLSEDEIQRLIREMENLFQNN